MGKGHYLGGHSQVTISEGGTTWETGEEATRPPDKTYKPWDPADKTENHSDIRDQKNQRIRQESQFVAGCAAALVAGSLSETNPFPTPALRREIKAIGGNLKWLYANNARLTAFARSAYGQGWKPE